LEHGGEVRANLEIRKSGKIHRDEGDEKDVK